MNFAKIFKHFRKTIKIHLYKLPVSGSRWLKSWKIKKINKYVLDQYWVEKLIFANNSGKPLKYEILENFPGSNPSLFFDWNHHDPIYYYWAHRVSPTRRFFVPEYLLLVNRLSLPQTAALSVFCSSFDGQANLSLPLYWIE